MAHTSHGSNARAGAIFGVYAQSSATRRPCSSLNELVNALKEDIDAGSGSFVLECTTTELSLDFRALIPLHQPTIGPYAEDGEHDLPQAFKALWTNVEDNMSRNHAIASKAHPQATVESIVTVSDQRERHIVQRAASRGIAAAVEALDGFKYYFNNAWGANKEDGQRFSYICQDSMQNKDRRANGYPRTQKHLKGERESLARKATYDCKGSVSIKCSLSRQCIDVYYRHYAVHPTVSQRKNLPRQRPVQRASTRASQPDTGGLVGELQAEDSAFKSPPSSAINGSTASNIGKPLKRKRDSDVPQQTHSFGKPLSLVDLLRQSSSTNSTQIPPPSTPAPTTNVHPAPVHYDLPSWQTPPAAPATRQLPVQPLRNGSQGSTPYAQPYRPYQTAQQQPPRSVTQSASRPPSGSKQQESLGLPRCHPQAQGLFTTMKVVPQDPPMHSTIPTNSTVPVYPSRPRPSCANCRNSKKRCDELRPVCGACQRAGKHDCVYDESNYYQPTPTYYDPQPAASASCWLPASDASAPARRVPAFGNHLTMYVPPTQQQGQAVRQESPDPWFPKR